MQENAENEAEQEKLLPEKLNELSNITYSDIAAKLLADKLLLTALELHCELTEVGKEIPKLKGFFSNPGNFEQNYLKTELPSAALSKQNDKIFLIWLLL